MNRNADGPKVGTAAGILLAALGVLSAFPALAADEEVTAANVGGLDHFKCYEILKGGVPPMPDVLLQDQFDSDQVEEVTLKAPELFCNPVLRKRHRTEISRAVDRSAHLKFYKLAIDEPVETRKILVQNQFGRRQVLSVTKPSALAVPTKKEPHTAPQRLDHFKCYDAQGKQRRPQPIVDLQDQFHWERGAKVGAPVLFCNPTHKYLEHGETLARNREKHLVCYQLDGSALEEPKTIKVHNQFGTEELTVQEAKLLCAPSKKRTFHKP